jgi:RHS repeat-associated protein
MAESSCLFSPEGLSRQERGTSSVHDAGTNLDTTHVYDTDPADFEKRRLLSITRGADGVAYTWDRFGRMLTDGALVYTWDKNGRRTSVTYPGNLKANYTFDRMDREASMTMQENGGSAITLVSATAGYKAYGPLVTTVHPTTTSRTVTRNYDLRYAPTSIVVSGSRFTWNYTVDGAGNPTAISQTLPTSVSRSYGYQDTQYFLDSASGPWSGPLSWTYDKIGNRLTETRGATTDTYSHEANSGATGNTARLDVVNLVIGGTRDYTFDAGGFLDLVDLGANQVDFTFDAAGQLNQITRPVAGETLNLRYDGRGFLCDASDVVSGGYTKPTYSSQGVVMSLDRLPDSTGTTEIHNVLYFAGIPVVLWKKVGTAASTRQHLVDDHLGTPVYAFSTARAAVWNGGLEPFGKDWQEGTANDMLAKGIFLRFPGQWDDSLFTNASLGSDPYYNLHRWYESWTGTYSRPDLLPMELLGEWQPYLYVLANPLAGFDPLGLAAFKPCSDLQVPSPCNCNKEKVNQALQGARSLREKFCRYRDSSELPPGIPAAGEDEERTVGKIDPVLGPVYRPRDPCLDWCVCQHEQQHDKDLGDPRVRRMVIDGLPDQQIVNWLECRAYTIGSICLQGFARGGVP